MFACNALKGAGVRVWQYYTNGMRCRKCDCFLHLFFICQLHESLHDDDFICMVSTNVYCTWMSLPNGLRASLAILKCWWPKGMPIMVRYRQTPKKTCVILIQIPANTIHIKFMAALRQPLPSDVLTTLEPKGQRMKKPIFQACLPKGIPTMVSMRRHPPRKYWRAASTPPVRP